MAITVPPVTIDLGEDCCCESEPCEDCPCCSEGYWTEYDFSVSGITNASCDGSEFNNCDVMNGDHTVTRDGGCYWHTPTIFNLDCDAPNEDFAWTLRCIADVWRLTTVESGLTYTSVDFNCVDGGEFAIDPSSSPKCAGHPTTITLTPAGTFVPCA